MMKTSLLTLLLCSCAATVSLSTVAHVVNTSNQSANVEGNLAMKGVDNKTNTDMTIAIEVVQLQDSQGLIYVGGIVDAAKLTPYLAQMATLLPDNFSNYRNNQALRDHGKFHMTLINPYEYKEVDTKNIAIGEVINISLLGLGHVAKGKQETYFVVVDSSVAQAKRRQLGLADKDFHITLGFNPNDIYGVSKGVERLIKPSDKNK